MEFTLVALGGTFDIIHAGHLALLQKGFSISKKVIIGLTSDEFASKNSKNLINDFQKRRAKLEFEINEKFPTSELIPYFFAVDEFSSINQCEPNIEIEGVFN